MAGWLLCLLRRPAIDFQQYELMGLKKMFALSFNIIIHVVIRTEAGYKDSEVMGTRELLTQKSY